MVASPWIAAGSLIGFPLVVVGVVVYLILDQAIGWSEASFPLSLSLAAFFPLIIRTGFGANRVFGLFLTSAAVLVSQVPIEAYLLEPGPIGRILILVWQALLWSFPFLFVHFALTFPVHNEWIASRPLLLKLVYIPLGILLISSHWSELEEIVDAVILFLFLFGFIVGLAIFFRQYLYSLTRAEKNRLRLVTVGCVVGAIPYLVFLLSAGRLPPFAGQMALFLTPLFPVCLTVAVTKANMSEVGRWFEGLLMGSTVAGTTFFVFACLSLFLPLFMAGGWGLVLSLMIAGVLGLPVIQRLRSYFATHFVFGVRRTSPQRSTQFEAIRPNPYIVGNPVRRPEMFFGREAEFQFIHLTLESQPGGCVILLVGERRTGKTSILYQIMQGRMGESYVPVFLDMQALVVDSDGEFLEALAAIIERALPGPDLFKTYLQKHTSFLAFSRFVESVARGSRSQRLIFLVDEYELIEQRIRAGKLSAEIPRFLNALIEQVPGLSYVFTGSSSFDPNSIWSELFGKSFYREISFLHRRDAEDLIRRPLGKRVQFVGNAVADLIRLSNGHPFFTQLLCQNLVDATNETRSGVVDSRRVKEVLQRVTEHPPPQLLYLWGRLSRVQKLALVGLASLLRTSRTYASRERVHQVLKSLPEAHTQGIDTATIRMALEQMRLSHLLDRDQTRYRLKMDLMRVWVQSEHTVWSVLSES